MAEARISPEQAAARLERLGFIIAVRSIQRWCQRGVLVATRVGGRWFIERTSIDAIAERGGMYQ